MKKKRLIFIALFIFAFNNCFLYSFIDTTIYKNQIEGLVYGYEEKVNVKSIIETEDEVFLDTSSLGDKIYQDKDNIIYYTVVDKTPPLIIGGNVTTLVGNKVDLVNRFLCGDEFDDTPKCYIEGSYDFNKVGTYDLKYIAIDKDNNKNVKDFKLKVIKEYDSDDSDEEETQRIDISEYIKKYKKENTSIGIDVSSWQNNIDWKKVKETGVEFVMIRIGFGHTTKGEIVLDSTYLDNIKGAKEAGLKVGLYFYSYASNKKEAKTQARWIIDTLDGESLDLPIAFDWEDWGDFNSYKVSFKTLSSIADTFIKEVEKNGYDGMLYGSAYHLKTMWKSKQRTWLAYYTDKNDYTGKYEMWQLSSRGNVRGIETPVDINILYK